MPQMAAWVQDAQTLTPLVLGVLIFIALVLYRNPVTALLHRLSRFRLQRGDWVAEGHMEHGESEAKQPLPGGAEDTPEGKKDQDEPRLLDDSSSLDEVEENGADERQPEDSAGENDPEALEKRMFEALAKRNEEEAERAFDRLQGVLTDPVDRKVARARWLALRAHEGLEPGAVEKLTALAEDEDAASAVLYLKGVVLQQAGQPRAAADAFRASRESEKTSPRRAARAAAEEAKSLQRAGDAKRAVELLEELLRHGNDDRITNILWMALAHVYEAEEQHELRALALQQALERAPADPELLFRIAYVYSDTDDDSFAPLILHFYERVLSFDPENTWAWNNSGVQLERLDLDIASVRRYQHAVEQGNTLASANVANKLMAAGFAHEADDLLKAAAAQPSPHENVASSTAALASACAREDDRQAELVQVGQQQAEFLSGFTKAGVFGSPDDWAGIWRFENGHEVKLDVKDGSVSGEWGNRKPKRKLQATIRAASGRGAFYKMGYSVLDPDKETGWRHEDNAYLYLADDARSISVMRLKEKGAEFEHLIRAS